MSNLIRIRTRDQLRCALLGVLHDIKEDRLINQRDIGICGCVSFEMRYKYSAFFCGQEVSEEVRVTLRAAFRAWPEFSGNAVFPVPAPTWFYPEKERSLACKYAYWEAREKYGELDHWAGEYGAARRRLLDFLIEYFSA